MANKLAAEKSPYLLQHALNPVDWYPWGAEAFTKANIENKPVFLSIGYSTCHWCHVMERESFEDDEVAQILNRSFVAIKVDREERPDIDHIYMSACQAMTGQGGWPLTILMTPEKKPFFAGTYFPKQQKWGRPGLVEILLQVEEKWNKDRTLLTETGDKVAGLLSVGIKSAPDQEFGEKTLHKALQQAKDIFDRDYGGFGAAPKFPAPHNLAFLLRCWEKSNDHEALAMVEKTLEAMYRGGIYDHVGGGFARYSTDVKWLVPHFEKMLYDNALLALVYTECYQATGRSLYARVAREILKYVLRDMTSPEGGFYSAEDADSEGVEGKYYVWTPAEIKEILGKEDGERFCILFDITDKGNFEGRSIPNLISAPDFDAAGNIETGAERESGLVENWLGRLFAAREKRVHPHKDDKILVSWNGLMIAALARAAAVFGDKTYEEAAARALEFIFLKMRREDGRLLTRYRDGQAAIPAYLDDYAFLAWGLLEMYEAAFTASYLEKAIEITGQMADLFWDRENGGFYLNGYDAEQLIYRPKSFYDGALPSGNSAALHSLLRLSRLTGETALAEMADRQVKAYSGYVGQYLWGFTHFLTGLDFMLGPARSIVIAGNEGDAGARKMLRALQQVFRPGTVAAFHQEGKAGALIEELAPHTKAQHSIDGRAAAYICENYACHEPVTDYRQFLELIK